MTCKYKVKIKDIQYNYKVQMTDIQSKYKFKVFCTGGNKELEEKVNTLYEAWPRVSGTGETITLNDTANTTMAIDLKGNTSKNLFDNSNSIWVGASAGKVNYDSSTDTFIFHRDIGGDYLVGKGKFNLKANTSYSIYINVLSNTMTSTMITGGANLSLPISIPAGATGEYVFSGTSNSDLSLNYDLWLYCNSTGTFEAQLMLVEGTYTLATILSYEPYGASVTGDNSIEVCGKNLVFSKIANENISRGGLLLIDNSFDMHIAKVTQGETYTITSNDINNGFVGGFFYGLPKNNMFTYNNQRVVSDSWTFTAPITGYVAFRSQAGYEYAQLEKGTTASEFEPYKGASYPISLGSTKLNTGDSIQYITDKWYIVRANETQEEITDSTLLSQLEAIKEAESYSGQTNISQTNDDKPFILTAKALKDLSNL